VTPHRLVNPEGLPRPSGYTHAVVAEPGRTVHVAGQIASDAGGTCVGETLVDQFGLALDNVVAALAAAGAAPDDVVSVQIFVTDVETYRNATRELGEAYRRRFGRHYPAMTLVGVTELFDPAALVELVAVAVVPEER
jgi:enamine deaminase RidA (YjgF/YER057c/UK114 family)